MSDPSVIPVDTLRKRGRPSREDGDERTPDGIERKILRLLSLMNTATFQRDELTRKLERWEGDIRRLRALLPRDTSAQDIRREWVDRPAPSTELD